MNVVTFDPPSSIEPPLAVVFIDGPRVHRRRHRVDEVLHVGKQL